MDSSMEFFHSHFGLVYDQINKYGPLSVSDNRYHYNMCHLVDSCI